MKITVVNPDEITDSVERNEIENIKKELNEEIQAPEVFEVEIPQEEKAPIIKEKKKLKPLFDSKTKEVKINSRTFTIQNWKGKNRRKFMEIFSKENKDIDLAIFEALIKDVISPNDIWLTEFELKYILSEIRILTFGDKTEFAWTCNNAKCQKRNITTGTKMTV